MSKGAVLVIISSARPTISSRGAPGPGIGCDFIGVVGISSRSQSFSAVSYAVVSRRVMFMALP